MTVNLLARGRRWMLRLPRRGAMAWRRAVPWLVCLLFGLAGVAVLDDYDPSGDSEVERAIAISTLYDVRDRIAARDTEVDDDIAWQRAFLTWRDSAVGDDVALQRAFFTWRDSAVGDDDRYQRAFRTYGMVFEASLLGVERLLGLQDSRAIYRMRHLLTHLLFLAGSLAGYALAFRLYRSRGLALVALSLFLLHPRLYAHSFFNAKDLPFFSVFMLALLLTHWAFRRGSVKAFLLCGACIGVLSTMRTIGLILLGAGLVMRTLDFLHADRSTRRRIGQTIGALAVAGTATIYALLPYLWSDPLRHFGEILFSASNHPLDFGQLFRGRYVRSVEPPFMYVPVWFAITTPWAVLGFGLLGSAATIRRGLRQRAALVHNTRLRFEGLLLACCALPVMAVVGLGATLYDDWRHLYFIAAPFGLLATGGVRVLAVAAGRAARWAYGAAGAGACATLAAMVSLHPYQYMYFNAFVDRATPGDLSMQYELDLDIVVSVRDALAFLLARDPPAPLYYAASFRSLDAAFLPAADRPRLVSVAPGNADFFVFRYPTGRPARRSRQARGSPPPASVPYAPVLYTRAVYGHTLMVAAALNLAQVEAATAAPYRTALRTLQARAPDARARFDVYRDAHAVSWVQEPCRPADTEPWFFLHVAPADPQALPPHRRQAGFAVLNFSFPERGVRVDDACLVSVPLPAYPVRALQVGQRPYPGAARPLWQADLPLAPNPAYRAAYRALTARPPTHRGAFDVYVGAATVTFAKQPCAAADTEPAFILRVAPVDPPAPSERYFEALDFPFFAHGARFDDVCLASVPLPAYPLRALQVGQQAPGAAHPRWQADLSLAPAPASPETRAAYRALAARPPTHRGPFDVYVTASTVTFAKQPCTAADLAPKFILHAAPVDPQALPGRPFANLDFYFPARGAQAADACLASVPRPAYPLQRLTVGQWLSGTAHPLWQADLVLPRAPRAGQADRRLWHALATASPAYRGVFDVHVAAHAVAYAKAPCAGADTEPKFILHVVPVRRRDLPPARRPAGFDNRDFRFDAQGAHFDGRCLARAPLPAYPIASLRVGQFRAGEEPLWVAEIPPAR